LNMFIIYAYVLNEISAVILLNYTDNLSYMWHLNNGESDLF